MEANDMVLGEANFSARNFKQFTMFKFNKNVILLAHRA